MFSGTNNYVICTQEVRRIKRRIYDGSNCAWGSKWHRVKNHVWPRITIIFTCCSTICEYFITSLASWLVRVIFGGTIIFGTEADV